MPRTAWGATRIPLKRVEDIDAHAEQLRRTVNRYVTAQAGPAQAEAGLVTSA